MPDERADVDRGAPLLDGGEELREGLEGPLGADPRAQGVERHALHLLEGAQHEIAMRGPRRRDAEAAVPHHHRGDAVPGRDGEHAVPEDLRVVVRVDVDEAGRDRRAVGVEDAVGGTRHRTDRRCARPVDERPAADQQVEVLGHRRSPRAGP